MENDHKEEKLRQALRDLEKSCFLLTVSEALAVLGTYTAHLLYITSREHAERDLTAHHISVKKIINEMNKMSKSRPMPYLEDE